MAGNFRFGSGRGLRTGIVVGTLLAWTSPASAMSLEEGFRNPPADAKPAFRWWWNDNRITADEIRREIALMAKAGAGGVEINPVGMESCVKNPTGEVVPWLSEAWNQLVKVAVDETRKHGMYADLIAGTGWPFGGPFITPEQAGQRVHASVTPICGWGGRRQFEGRVPIPDDPHRTLRQAKLFPRRATKIQQGQDVTDTVAPDGSATFRVPWGETMLYVVTHQCGFQEVGLSAPGGEGLAIDHFNVKVVRDFLDRMSYALSPAMGGRLGNGLRAIFCDSLELLDTNWASDLPEIFAARRGYELEPYLPLVLTELSELQEVELGDTIRRVRYDFNKTLAELFAERFYQVFHDWCHDNGVQSRLQVYGSPWLRTDLVDSNQIPDIPEGDIWIYLPSQPLDGVRYIAWNKYASSGGHLAGRRLISSEAMTNTVGVFRATLADIKQATDINFMTGVNHLVLHGFNYSPPEAGFPGWVRYGTYFNEHNPWWPYLNRWCDYTARLCWIFQQAKPVSQVAILGPTPDTWSRPSGLNRDRWMTTPRYVHDLWPACQQAGYGVDYVSGTVLQNARFEGGKLCHGPMAYDVLLVADVESVEAETARAIRDYARAGGCVVFIDRVPSRSPGFQNARQNDARVQALIAEARRAKRVSQVVGPQSDKVLPWVQVTLKTAGVVAPVEIQPGHDRLFQLHARDGKREVFFFANAEREKTLDSELVFHDVEGYPWRWDAETGQRRPEPYTSSPDRLSLQLKPLESRLIVFEPEAHEVHEAGPAVDRTRSLAIAGPWRATFESVAGQRFERTMETLVDLVKDEELKTFGGTVTYRTSFEVSETELAWLDLGTVYGLSEVTINGQTLAPCWYGPHEYDLRPYLKAGANRLEVKVATVLYNYCRSLQDNPVAQRWTEGGRHYQEQESTGLVGPVALHPVR